jgi:DNA-binding NarL/FixJ family response regulator
MLPHPDARVGKLPGRRYSRTVSVRLVVADDNLIAREGILQLLALEPEFEVVAACGDLQEVLEAVDREAPDAVLTDIRMPPSHSDEGIRIANRLRGSHPAVGVIVLSQYDEPMLALSLLESGSDRRGYLLKERVHDPTELRDAVQAVVRGGVVIDPTLVDALVKGKAAIERSALAELSPRERQVLAEIAQGKSNSAIAESLVLSKRAVEKHINSIFLKLGLGFVDDVSKRVKATLMYLSESELPAAAAAGDD